MSDFRTTMILRAASFMGSENIPMLYFQCPNCGAPQGHRRREDPGDCALCDATDTPKEGPTHGFCLGLDLHQVTESRLY